MNFLKKLFSGGKQETVELPPEFLQAAPPDWLIELNGTTLPAGNPFSIQVQLITASRFGTADILLLLQNGNKEPKNSSIVLPRLVLDKLFVILGFSFPDDIADVSPTEAGLPITISIHQREPYSTRRAKCDLTDWLQSRKAAPPVIEISRLLVEAAGILSNI